MTTAAQNTREAISSRKIPYAYRPLPGASFPPGTLCKLASTDLQLARDAQTIQPTGTTASEGPLVGIVASDFMEMGFNGNSAAPSFVAPGATARGTQSVFVIEYGVTAALVDNSSATNSTAIVHGTPLGPSRATAGKLQGLAAPVVGQKIAHAVLPANVTLTAGAQVQASQTIAIAGAPATNDLITVSVQTPFTDDSPGIVQMRAIATTLTAAQATTATTAAAAIVAALNADPQFSALYVASNAAGVITITAIPTAKFLTTFGAPTGDGTVAGRTTLNLSGSAANGLAVATSAVGGSTATAGGPSLAGGVGYVGSIAAMLAAA